MQMQLRDQQRSEVSRRVTEQLRQDVLVHSLLYKDSIIMSRKAWVDDTQSFTLINNIKMANVEEKVKRLSSLSNDDILAMVSCIMNRRELLKHTPLLDLLEEECCRRVNTLDLQTMLLMADSFYVLKHSQTKYMRTVLQSVDLHWNSLEVTPRCLVQLLFYIGTYRNAPIQLMERIEDFLVENISDVTGHEIGLICHAFFSSNTSLHSFPLMNKMADIILRDLHRMKSYLVANVLKVFRHANFSNFTFYDQLGDADILRGDSYVSTIIHFVTTYSAMRFVHDALYESVARNFSQYLVPNKQNRTQIRMKDFTKFLWAFSTVQRAVPQVILDAATECVRRDQALWRRYPETFIECLVSLAMNSVYPHDLINYALSPDFLRFKRGRRLEQYFQTVLLDLAVGLECPQYRGNRISPEEMDTVPKKELGDLSRELKYRQGLAPLVLTLRDMCPDASWVKCHFILKSSKVADIELYVDSNNRLQDLHSQSTHTDTGDLSQLLQQNKASECGAQVTARGSVIETLLQQKRGSQQGSQQLLLSRTEPKNIHLKPDSQKKDKGGRRIAVKLMGWNQFAVNRPILLGIHQMELRLLCKLGYEVLAINPKQATEFCHMTREGQRKYVTEKIFKTLDIQS